MLNIIFVFMIVCAIICGALTGRMDAVGLATTDAAKSAVNIAIGLIGVMAFWIGAMQVLHAAGILRWIAKALRPLMRWLFPDIPEDHPAVSWMIMNMTSNMLGLGNAATPFGLKAMIEMDKINPQKGTATDSMALFLAINTSHLALLPTGIIALRASLGSEVPAAIILPTWLATTASTFMAILIAKTFARMRYFSMERTAGASDTQTSERPDIDVSDIGDTSAAEAAISAAPPLIAGWRLWLVISTMSLVGISLMYGFTELVYGTPEFFAGFKGSLVGCDGADCALVEGQGWIGSIKAAASTWPLPLLIGVILFLGVLRNVNVYECIVEGGKEGFNIAVKIIPYMVAILVALKMLDASGALGLFEAAVSPITQLIGMPAEVLPMAVIRPLSGGGAFAVCQGIMEKHGPDSIIGYMVSTMNGSTETTFYVLAVYFGLVGIQRIRHTMIACLCADMVGLVMSVWAVRWFLG